MKKFLHDLAVCGAVCAATVGLMAGFEGCSTNTVTTASTVNGVLVLGVDGSMQGWALYVNGNTNVPDSEICLLYTSLPCRQLCQRQRALRAVAYRHYRVASAQSGDFNLRNCDEHNHLQWLAGGSCANYWDGYAGGSCRSDEHRALGPRDMGGVGCEHHVDHFGLRQYRLAVHGNIIAVWVDGAGLLLARLRFP